MHHYWFQGIDIWKKPRSLKRKNFQKSLKSLEAYNDGRSYNAHFPQHHHVHRIHRLRCFTIGTYSIRGSNTTPHICEMFTLYPFEFFSFAKDKNATNHCIRCRLIDWNGACCYNPRRNPLAILSGRDQPPGPFVNEFWRFLNFDPILLKISCASLVYFDKK